MCRSSAASKHNKYRPTRSAATGEQHEQEWNRNNPGRGRAYHELLLRSDEPREGDAAALAECMRILERGEDDLQGDAELVHRISVVTQAGVQVQVLAPQFKEARVERKRVATWADEQRAKLEEKIRQRVAVAEKAYNSARGAYNAASALAGEAQLARDEWECIASGRPLDAIQAARRRAKITAPQRQKREEIIEARRHETVTLRLFPLDASREGMVKSVNAALVHAGYKPLTNDEIVNYGVRGWLAGAAGRVLTQKEPEAQASGAA
jgi:hypothetical protein